jgi:response regulator NasT
VSEPITCLIVDDHEVVREGLRLSLSRSENIRVVGEASDGQAAVTLAKRRKPNVVILDVRMPGLDGIEAARRITASRPVPVILLTAYDDRSLVERAIGAGVFAYLVKPFAESDLVPALELAWARHADWLDARRELGRRTESAASQAVEVTVEGTHRYPLLIERRPDGTVDVSLDSQER